MHCALETIFNKIIGKGGTLSVPESGNGELFSVPQESACAGEAPAAPCAASSATPQSAAIDPAALGEAARRIFELSVNAWDAIIHAWMSELPITAEIIRFGQKVLAAASTAAPEAERRAAETATADRGDSDVLTVLAAAYKVWHETHRLLGLLRFSPDANGVYIARCEPDHFVLPALGEHFERRFGVTPWAVIDEKRRLCLYGRPGSPPRIAPVEQAPLPSPASGDPWESLWKHYHQTINNESRSNPRLQRQFMPKRYWKYLPEM